MRKHAFEATQTGYERFVRGRFVEAPLAPRPIVCVISFDADELLPYLRNLLLRVSEARASPEVILGITAGGEAASEQLPVAVAARTIPVVASFQQLLQNCAQAAHVQAKERRNAGHSPTGTDARLSG